MENKETEPTLSPEAQRLIDIGIPAAAIQFFQSESRHLEIKEPIELGWQIVEDEPEDE